MSETTAIEWCDSTFNPWIGCTKVSPACDHCYAEALMDKRHGRVKWGGTRSRTSATNWHQPVRWQKQAIAFRAEHGRRRRVFCASLADVFDNQVPTSWRDDLWALIRATPDLDWLLLTKRPMNIAKMKPFYWDQVKGHVWLGTTVEDQERANLNIPHLLQHDAAVRFVSIEPMLGPVGLDEAWHGESALDAECWGECAWCDKGYPALHNCQRGLGGWERGRSGIDWVIAGGESGPQARPSHPDWYRSLRDQCAADGVPFLFKQWGHWSPGEYVMKSDGLWFHAADGREFPGRNSWPALHFFEQHAADQFEGPGLAPIGKSAAGRLLDGVEHNGFPA